MHFLKTLLLPHVCVLCGKTTTRDQDLCVACFEILPILTHFCPKCARRLTVTAHCYECQTNPPPFDVIHALFAYRYPITKLILTLKFNNAILYGKILGELLTQQIQQVWYHEKKLPDFIIPMPLHKTRLKERGFNQAVEIARPIARTLKIPLDTTHVKRVKATKPQATLDLFARQKNLEQAFSIQKDFTAKHIAILDDVVTTGFTVKTLADALKKHGASRVDIWCAARAEL